MNSIFMARECAIDRVWSRANFHRSHKPQSGVSPSARLTSLTVSVLTLPAKGGVCQGSRIPWIEPNSQLPCPLASGLVSQVSRGKPSGRSASGCGLIDIDAQATLMIDIDEHGRAVPGGTLFREANRLRNLRRRKVREFGRFLALRPTIMPIRGKEVLNAALAEITD